MENIILPCPSEIILSEMQKTGPWINFEDWNDWEEPTYKFRISGGAEQYYFIGDKYPGFLVVLNEGTENPKKTYGLNWSVYVNTFVPPTIETQLLLKSIGCTIDKNPDMPELILECEELNLTIQ